MLFALAPSEAAAYTPPAVQYTGAIAGTDTFVHHATGPGIRPNPSSDQLGEDHEQVFELERYQRSAC